MILIFGGTTEGRIAIQTLEEAGKTFYYSTKGDEQDVLLHNGIRLQGAMDAIEIETFCAQHHIKLLIDAAHPFATQLHETLEQVSVESNIPVIRFERIFPERDEEHIIWCRDYDDAIEKIQKEKIFILLALTGVQTIGKLKPLWQNACCYFRILDRDSSRKLALALGTKGLVNIQYLIWENELYVIEVNPRASRTVPYISKVTGVPMVDVAARVMLGAPLASLGYGTGLHPIPPYYAVKVPVFSFEKLGDVNAYLGPEMKSTGEVLGLGKTMQEALFKGLTSAGMVVGQHPDGRHGVFVSVDTHDLGEIVSLAKKLDDLHFALYATEETAAAIARLGIDVVTVDGIRESDHAFALLESGCIDYIVYTGALKDATMDDYIALHRRALQLGIPCFTSLDTANALADIIASRYNERNTELVDINHMRTERQSLKFAKMQATGDDYIYVENFDGHITCPESLCIPLCSRHRGIGGYGIVLIEHSNVADAKMRVFNRDGSAGGMGGNAIRCVAKYLYDNGIVPRDDLTIEAGGLVHRLHLYTRFGTVGLVTVDMGKPAFEPANVPVMLPGNRVIDRPVTIAGGEYRITCLSMGNPHCVVFADRVDEVDVAHLGPQFEHADIFPARTNTEFIRVVNRTTIKMRVWERGNGETRACGTGACAAVVAATENGLCPKGEPITVKVSGGDLIVTYDDDGVRLTGNAELAFTGVTTY